MESAPMFGDQQLPNMRIRIERPLAPDHLKRQSKDEEAFWKFHNANPHLYEKFDQECMRVLHANIKKYSARTIIHYLRHNINIETRSNDGYKISDHHSKFYGLLWVYNNPDQKDFFTFKKNKDEDVKMIQKGMF